MENQENNNIIYQKLAELEQKIDLQTQIIARVYKIQKIGMYTRYGYWAFFILISLGTFYFISPFLNTLKETYLGSSGLLQILDGTSAPEN